jgi:hypothetical protein
LRSKTRDFDSLDKLTDYLQARLPKLYDELEVSEAGGNSDSDYVQGSIDTTQHYLLKCGIEDFMTYEQYLDIVAMEWRPAN